MEEVVYHPAKFIHDNDLVSNNQALMKYQSASMICNDVMRSIAPMIVAGTRVVDVCRFGDEMIEAEVSCRSKCSTGKGCEANGNR